VPSPALERALDFRQNLDKTEDGSPSEPGACAVHIHGYYINELWNVIDTLQNKLNNFDLFVTTNSLEKKEAISDHLETHTLGRSARKWEVIQTPDRGRNIGPLLIDTFDRLTGYDCALHLHSKRSEHWGSDSNTWTESLHENLAGSAELINEIRSAFMADPQLGLLIPQTSEAIRPWVEWGRNFSIAKIILQGIRHDLNLHIDAPLIFPTGMMFWFRPSALVQLSEACRKLQPLPLEPLPLDGSPLHAIERLVAHSCEASGYRWQLICTDKPNNGSQHLDLQPSVLTPLTETYIQASSILGVKFRKLQLETKNMSQDYEERIRKANEALSRSQEELRLTHKKKNFTEGELLMAQQEIACLRDENNILRNRISARVASKIMAAIATIFGRRRYRNTAQKVESETNE